MFDSFAAVAGDRLELSRLSKATLIDLSHVLEDLFLDDDLPGVVMTGFQSSRNWRSEVRRYERLAGNDDRAVAIFTNDRLALAGRVLGFTLAEDSGMRQEWFIIALTETFSCALFGVDNGIADPATPFEEMDRLFDATWTFDPTVISDLCDLVLAEAATGDPQRADVMARAVASYPPREPSRSFERRFNRLTFEALEASRNRWRRQLLFEQELNERLRTAEARLRRLERLAAIGTMASSLAHEINNPLSTIGMAADLIVAEMIDPTGPPTRAEPGQTLAAAWVAEHATLISTTVGRVGRMVRGILDLVRTEDIAVGPIELTSWMGRVAEELTIAVGRAVRCSTNGPVTVLVDADRLRHVITNLVRNAAEADVEGKPIDIEVDQASNGRVMVTVTDQGPGVPVELLPTMFQPFVTSRASSGGTGLGLPLAQRFAEDLGGSLELLASSASGTTFAVTLRVIEPPPGPDEPAPDRMVADLFVPVVAARRALILDDEPMLRETLATILRRDGWTAAVASTPVEAAELLAAESFDVLIVDYRLSRTTTFTEVRLMLESVRPGSSRRMLVITGSLASELTDDDLPPVLTKPFTQPALEAALLEVIARSAGND